MRDMMQAFCYGAHPEADRLQKGERIEETMKNGDWDGGRENLAGLTNWKSECFFIYTNLTEQRLIHVVPKHKKNIYVPRYVLSSFGHKFTLSLVKCESAEFPIKIMVFFLSLVISQTVIVQ